MAKDLLLICFIMVAAFVGLILVAILSKYRELGRIRNYAATTGTITKSHVRSHRNPSKSSEGFDTLPLVTYEYDVDGVQYRGTRISPAEKISGEEIPPILDKYPVGKIVQVYYDPANPRQAILERDLPAFIGRITPVVIVVLIGAAILLPIAFVGFADWLGAFLPDPGLGLLTTVLLAMTFFAFLMAFANQKQVWAAQEFAF